MKRYLCLMLILLFGACSKENSLTVNLNTLSTSLIPSIQDSIQFSSSNGDTISMFPINSSIYFSKISGTYDQGGSLPDLDFIELEIRETIIANQAENIFFKFNVSAEYQSDRPQYSNDAFVVSRIDSNGVLIQLLNSQIQDSLICPFANQDCFHLDTLEINGTKYQPVYYNNSNNSSITSAFISPMHGLIKFIDRDSVVFELIP